MSLIPGPESPRYLALLQLLGASDAIWEASRLFFVKWDLSPSQFNVLNLLHLHPKGLTQTELSRRLIVHRSNVTGLVDRLEKRGLVQRQEVAADRRAYRVVLSPAGQRVVAEVLPRYYEDAEELWGGVSERATREMTRGLRVVAEAAQRIGARFAKRKEPL